MDRDIRVSTRDEASGLATYQEEIEANQFAAELLMPEDQIRERLGRLSETDPQGDALVTSLANIFDVSAQAMEYRLLNLGYRGIV